VWPRPFHSALSPVPTAPLRSVSKIVHTRRLNAGSRTRRAHFGRAETEERKTEAAFSFAILFVSVCSALH